MAELMDELKERWKVVRLDALMAALKDRETAATRADSKAAQTGDCLVALKADPTADWTDNSCSELSLVGPTVGTKADYSEH
jgi:hypothetical protein